MIEICFKCHQEIPNGKALVRRYGNQSDIFCETCVNAWPTYEIFKRRDDEMAKLRKVKRKERFLT